jgi:hypothetical protein
VKKTVTWLNKRGYRTRLGTRFGEATLHSILTNSIYVGQWVFNKRDSRTPREELVDQWIMAEVPRISEQNSILSTRRSRPTIRT